MGTRFIPGCSCCETCENAHEDDFNRTTLGSDWVVASGSWSCNGSQLTGSGGIDWQPSGGVYPGFKVKLDAGILRVCEASSFPTNYIQIGDGSVSLYVGGVLYKQVTGWQSSGEFTFCTRINETSLGMNYAVTGGGKYDVFDISTWNDWMSGYFEASSTVQLDYVTNFDAPESEAASEAETDCCPVCPSCKSRHILSGAYDLILDDGVNDPFLLDTTSPEGGSCSWMDAAFTWKVYLYDEESSSNYDDKLPQAQNVNTGQWFLGDDAIDNCRSFSVTLTEQNPPGPFPAETVTLSNA